MIWDTTLAANVGYIAALLYNQVHSNFNFSDFPKDIIEAYPLNIWILKFLLTIHSS